MSLVLAQSRDALHRSIASAYWGAPVATGYEVRVRSLTLRV